MRYFLLILLIAGGYYGWDYYQTELVSRHQELKAMEQAPCPELDEAQARLEEAVKSNTQQVARLQEVIRKKEEFVCNYWEEQMKKAENTVSQSNKKPSIANKPHALNPEERIARLLAQYDHKAAEVEALKNKCDITKQQLRDAQNKIQEQIRQVETRLDINRIQREEASNTKSKEFKVSESRAKLLNLQAELPQELERITRKGEALLREQSAAYEKADKDLNRFRDKVDKQILRLRNYAESLSSENDDMEVLLADDPAFSAVIAPYDQAVDHEERLALQTEAELEKQLQNLHGIQRNRDGRIHETRHALESDEKIFFTLATVMGVFLLTLLLRSLPGKR